jgi:hypothetical protein
MATEAQCVLALDEHEEALTRRKNVVGLGVVPLDEAGGGKSGMAVAVYVRKKLPASGLAEKDVVPESLTVRKGKRVVEVPTRVIEQGKVEHEKL